MIAKKIKLFSNNIVFMDNLRKKLEYKKNTAKGRNL